MASVQPHAAQVVLAVVFATTELDRTNLLAEQPKWVRFLGQLWRQQHGYCGRRIYQTHCATHTGPDTDAVYGSPTPRTADTGRSAAVRVTRAATSLFTGVRVHCPV
ncbi:Hypothetical_protein [Hexamita inflata]|uniref:Hypothetical_protein n=1 Tax=Hexamita inflata TaxID=28002 RepID=A0AA86PDJ1_9EUKA|nr:Hypothetical protein HINF_LOCUS23456 [Hexamita inflata]